MTRPITIGLSPNTETDDVTLALTTLLSPWTWQTGTEKEWVRGWLGQYFQNTNIFLCKSGRSAFSLLLKHFGIGKGDEVIIQAFTCMVVPNSIRNVGAIPVYADTDDTLNIDVKKIRKSITKKTKAILVQHTFGMPAGMDAIVSIAKKHQVLVIEDLAHSFGGLYKGKKLGTFGDGAFVSFGRDKVLSSVFGGAGIINRGQRTEDRGQIFEIEKKLKKPTMGWIAQQLLHPIACSIILPLYDVLKIGKGILVVMQKAGFLSKPVEKCELEGKVYVNEFYAFPNALAILLKNQLVKLERYNKDRRAIAQFYMRSLPKTPVMLPDTQSVFLRYPLLCEHPKDCIQKARRACIYLGNWYHNVIDPEGSDKIEAGYNKGSCPKAEYTARHIINLPTRITKKQAHRVVCVLKTLL